VSFYVYMLHCAAGIFYVGQTDDLERRMAEHESGQVPGFSKMRQPVKLVWSEAVQTRDDAKAIEKKIKGWSRAKKLALIRADWKAISILAQSSEAKGRTVLRQAQDSGIVGAKVGRASANERAGT
jgi:predicted GIY-YIG superfamily endonuclease